MKKKISLVIGITIIMLIGIFLLGKSLSLFSYTKEGETVNTITINGIVVKILNKELNSLNLENTYPVSDSEALSKKPFEFEMTNTSNGSITYNIFIQPDEEKLASCTLNDKKACPVLDTSYIKYSYKKNDGTYSEPRFLSDNNNLIDSGTILGEEIIKSSVILWIDSEAGNEIMNHYFYGKIVITGQND